MLVDLRTKFPELTGKLAEKCLVAADITTNKNMVPFDSRSPFQTSGLRFGTPAITTRGLKEDKMDYIVGLIDRVLHDPGERSEHRRRAQGRERADGRLSAFRVVR